MFSPHPVFVLALLMSGIGAGCGGRCEANEDSTARRAHPAPARPASCRTVAPDQPLADALAAAAPGDALCLAPGVHRGPVVIPAGVTVWGPREAVVAADAGAGHIVSAHGAGARIAGFTVDGQGGRYDRFDAAVHVSGEDVVVEGLTIVRPVYGILVEKARRAVVRQNRVEGGREVAMGMRGDTIRLWETHDSVIADNDVSDGRDMVVWYSTGNRITGNRVRGGRYGTHFMYSHDNVVEGNSFRGGVVAVFVMYSRRVTLRDNLMADVGGSGGMGVGLKDSSDVTLSGNLLLRANVGLYIDQTPGDVGGTLVVEGNVLRQCESAILLHTTPHGTDIRGNDFADNVELFRASSGIDPLRARWRDNFYDTYAGYDLDGDERGDMPFEHQSASEELIAKHPDVAFFRGSPVLGMLDAGSRLLPLSRPRVLVTDPSPRMTALDLGPWIARFDDGTTVARVRSVGAHGGSYEGEAH